MINPKNVLDLGAGNCRDSIFFSNCTIIEHPGNDHMIALTLRDKGKLTEIIDKAIGIDEDIVDISL